MRKKSAGKKRRTGCIIWFLVIGLLCAGSYWLLLSPIPEMAEQNLPGIIIDGNIGPGQATELEEMVSSSGENINVLAQDGQIQYLTVSETISHEMAPSVQEKALYFIEEHKELFLLENPAIELRIEAAEENGMGYTYVRFIQQHQGVPVHGSGITIGVDRDGTIKTVNADYIPHLDVNVQPGIRSITAEEIALEDIDAQDGLLLETTTLEIYAESLSGNEQGDPTPILAWYVTIGSEARMESLVYVIDANRGEIIERIDQTLELGGGELTVIVFELGPGDQDEIPVSVLNQSTQPAREPSDYSISVINNIQTIDSYYDEHFAWDVNEALDSKDGVIDGDGLLNILVITNDCAFTAKWNGERLRYCTDYSYPLDVTAHEFTHILSDTEVGFASAGEPLEMNEALADVFAAFSSTDQFRWRIDGPQAKVIRDLASPHEDFPTTYLERLDQCVPGSMFGEYEETYPGCEHVNSIVFSHAVYLMSEDHEENGLPLNKLEWLLFKAITSPQMGVTSGQQQAARIVGTTCLVMINEKLPSEAPMTNSDCYRVYQAFAEVGLYPSQGVEPIIPGDPGVPEAPEFQWGDLLRGIREKINELLGKWSPLLIWAQIQDLIDELRSNTWVILADCIRRSDRVCIDQYWMELITTLINRMLEIFVNTCCTGIGVPLILSLALIFHRKVKAQESQAP